MKLNLEERKKLADELQNLIFVRIRKIILYEDSKNITPLLSFLKAESLKESDYVSKNNIFTKKIVDEEVYNLFLYFYKSISSDIFIDDIEELVSNNTRKYLESRVSVEDPKLREFLDNNLLRSVRVGSILNFISLISIETSIHLSEDLSEEYKLLTRDFSGDEYSTDETKYKKYLSNSERVKISLKIRDFGERCFLFFCNEIKKSLEMQNA